MQQYLGFSWYQYVPSLLRLMSQRYIHSSILEIGVYHYHCVVDTVAKPGAIDSYLHFLASLIVGTNQKIATVSARTRSNLLFSCVVSFFL